MIKFVIEFIVICLLIYGYMHEEQIAKWERKTVKRFWKWATRHVNKMIRAYEMAHQEVHR